MITRFSRVHCTTLGGGAYRHALTQTSQQDVSEAFGIAHTIGASDFDQLGSEYGLQALVAVKFSLRNVIVNR
jgi:hypothetical protein